MVLGSLMAMCCTQSILGMLSRRIFTAARIARGLTPQNLKTYAHRSSNHFPKFTALDAQTIRHSSNTCSLQTLQSYQQYERQHKDSGSTFTCNFATLPLLAASFATTSPQSKDDKPTNPTRAFELLAQLLEDISSLAQEIDKLGSPLELFFADEKKQLKARQLQLEFDKKAAQFQKNYEALVADIQKNIPQTIDEQISYFDHLEYDLYEEAIFPLWLSKHDDKLHAKTMKMSDLLKELDRHLFSQYSRLKDKREAEQLEHK